MDNKNRYVIHRLSWGLKRMDTFVQYDLNWYGKITSLCTLPCTYSIAHGLCTMGTDGGHVCVRVRGGGGGRSCCASFCLSEFLIGCMLFIYSCYWKILHRHRGKWSDWDIWVSRHVASHNKHTTKRNRVHNSQDELYYFILLRPFYKHNSM